MNKFKTLPFPLLFAAAALELAIFAAVFCSGGSGDGGTGSDSRSAFADRQFLAAIEEQSRKEGQIAAVDREFLVKIQEEALAAIPRAEFVAPPRSGRLIVERERATMPIMDPSSSPVPRATFVAPPRSQTVPVRRAEASDRAPRLSTRRAAIIIYDGGVFTTRATVMN